jgi:hypothetical protein
VLPLGVSLKPLSIGTFKKLHLTLQKKRDYLYKREIREKLRCQATEVLNKASEQLGLM